MQGVYTEGSSVGRLDCRRLDWRRLDWRTGGTSEATDREVQLKGVQCSERVVMIDQWLPVRPGNETGLKS